MFTIYKWRQNLWSRLSAQKRKVPLFTVAIPENRSRRRTHNRRTQNCSQWLSKLMLQYTCKYLQEEEYLSDLQHDMYSLRMPLTRYCTKVHWLMSRKRKTTSQKVLQNGYRTSNQRHMYVKSVPWRCIDEITLFSHVYWALIHSNLANQLGFTQVKQCRCVYWVSTPKVTGNKPWNFGLSVGDYYLRR